MKKLTACLLLLAMLLSCAIAEEKTELPDIDLSAIDWAIPNSELSEDFEQEGAEGEVRLAGDVNPTSAQADEAEEEAFVDGFTPDDVSRMIIDGDDRVTVNNTKAYPYSTMANMKVTGECKCKWECTGFMVGKKFLLTAAHCMICPEHNKWAKNVTFYFGYQSSSKYLYKYTGGWYAVAGTSFPNGYKFDQMSHDWCYLKLDKAVGEKTGWLGFNIASDSEINTRYYTVAGYRDNKLKYGFGWAAAYDENLMLFNADEVAGNSGGPVYLNYQDRADAIIVAEAPEANVNIGRRITRYIWDCMQKDGYQ